MVSVGLTHEMPSSTRMLLAGDGSTTVLLEALVGTRLRVRVASQQLVPFTRIPKSIREALAADGVSCFVERRSELHSSKNVVVSRNRVISVHSGFEAHFPAHDTKPIGHRLREERLPQAREMLASGVTLASAEFDSRSCAFKEYVINSPSRSPLYVAETFNPDVVRCAPLRQIPGTKERHEFQR